MYYNGRNRDNPKVGVNLPYAGYSNVCRFLTITIIIRTKVITSVRCPLRSYKVPSSAMVFTIIFTISGVGNDDNDDNDDDDNDEIWLREKVFSFNFLTAEINDIIAQRMIHTRKGDDDGGDDGGGDGGGGDGGGGV
uniref:Uncharacterized protein n=1 Tax=Glossina brevipalpis TaxID=37001 RepID=A0A1A9WVD5_9MUSC